MRILIIDDEDAVRTFLRRVLEEESIECSDEGDPRRALEMLGDDEQARFDLILLDVVMPTMSGLEFLFELRTSGNETPVIVLSGKDTLDQRVKSLRLGADDYVIKPFAPSELLARVEAVVRRRQSLPVLEMGDLKIDLGRRQVFRSLTRIDLSPGEFDVLRVLMEKRGDVVSRKELLKSVWNMDFDPGTKVVEVQVARLRRKIDRSPPPMIQTVVGEGYRIATPETMQE